MLLHCTLVAFQGQRLRIPVKMQEGRFFRQMNVKIVSYYDTYLQSLLQEDLWYTQTLVTLCNLCQSEFLRESTIFETYGYTH